MQARNEILLRQTTNNFPLLKTIKKKKHFKNYLITNETKLF